MVRIRRVYVDERERDVAGERHEQPAYDELPDWQAIRLPRHHAHRATCLGEDATIVGTDGADSLVGTAGDDVIAALGGDDHVMGTGGNDRICLGAGNDTASGGLGNDSIRGGKGNDAMQGNGDDDRLIGQQGHDKAVGGAGHDVCRAESTKTCEVGALGPRRRAEPSRPAGRARRRPAGRFPGTSSVPRTPTNRRR